MSLFLLELQIGSAEAGSKDRDAAAAAIERVAGAAAKAGAELFEAAIAGDHGRAFVVISASASDVVASVAQTTGLEYTGPDSVRLVGATEEEVRAGRGDASYLVEWDFPPELTMETYLERKREKSPLYAKVPEVTFLHTYVREDMAKCLCLYDASCEADVRRAREAVSTPISRLHELGSAPDLAHVD